MLGVYPSTQNAVSTCIFFAITTNCGATIFTNDFLIRDNIIATGTYIDFHLIYLVKILYK